MERFNFFHFAIFTLLFIIAGCESPKTENGLNINGIVVTNPLFKIAPEEYANLAEKAIMNLSNFEFDKWEKMLSDSVEFSFPDGDENTRTTIIGKVNLINWWKNWQTKTATKSMTMSGFNHFPLVVTGKPKKEVKSGIYVLTYFSSKIVLEKDSTAVRMNFITHFDAHKKIDKYVTYYDSKVFTKALRGKNILTSKHITKYITK